MMAAGTNPLNGHAADPAVSTFVRSLAHPSALRVGTHERAQTRVHTLQRTGRAPAT